jgi:hypothetical protein
MKSLIKSISYTIYYYFKISFSITLFVILTSPAVNADQQQSSSIISHFTLNYNDEDYDAQLGQVDFDDLMPQHYLMKHLVQEEQEYFMKENNEQYQDDLMPQNNR